jgi:hypothetical protein
MRRIRLGTEQRMLFVAPGSRTPWSCQPANVPPARRLASRKRMLWRDLMPACHLGRWLSRRIERGDDPAFTSSLQRCRRSMPVRIFTRPRKGQYGRHRCELICGNMTHIR